MSDQPITDATDQATDQPDAAPYYRGPNNARWVVIGFVALIVAFVVYMALGMPGMDHGGGDGMDHDMDGMDMGKMLPSTSRTP